ncbi:Glutaminyl-tRNA synthase, glutamine-hydrolyzing, subunit A [Alkalihalophilus pseudofirmus OF4]|uniref:Glutaminyl-tRNA synthase, glutamine-hydrolyzing, subunit A n=2 Tax=Bacillaceae TaxID=186817 RepID=D3FUG2_ALKPO|nr:Glutaminyl-tRNA synthase, glutamine-hydrolyzing, subunit A [Alkalihalophilus pseudofirmus OF4]
MIDDTCFLEATIEELQRMMDLQEVTAVELTRYYLDRIAAYDQNLSSVLEVNPDALHIAAALDAERTRTGKRSILHGIPVLLKDNIDTKDKLHTSAGALVLEHSYAKKDAFLVKKLRKAGAVILGKTNMSEWAYFMSTDNMPSGYSSRGGQTENPYGIGKFDVGGSSSGSGSAIAANFAAAAVGTETSGSILSPSSQNSIVGIKPTVGLISRSGIIPLSHTQDTAGPMARTVRDAVFLLCEMMGMDEEDLITSVCPYQPDQLLKALNKSSLNEMRIGVVREQVMDLLGEEKREVYETALKQLSRAGANVIDDVNIPSSTRKWSYNVLTYEFKANVNKYLSELDSSMSVRTLTDIIEWNENHHEKALKYGQSLLIEADKTSGKLTEKEYLKALNEDAYFSATEGIDAVLREHQLDVIVFPNNLGAAIPAKAGYPSITVPAGYTESGEPVGITFTAKAWQEPLLIEIAEAFEKLTKARKEPLL